MSSKATGSLFRSLRKLLEEHDWKELVIGVVRQCYESVGRPVGIAMFLLYIVLRVYLHIRNTYIYPPTAADFHAKALQLYQTESQSKRPDFTQVIAVLHQAKEYTPAQLSLAALYLYQQGKAEDSLDILNQIDSSKEKECENAVRALRLDAQALQQGQGHMIASVIGKDEYLSRSFARSQQPVPAASTKKPVKESKKDR